MERTTDVVSISLPPEMVAELDLVCKIEHRTRSELIREALRRYYGGYRCSREEGEGDWLTGKV